MRVTLTSFPGRDARRVIAVHAGDIVRVGRKPDADFVFAEDEQMSGLHFRLECLDHACRIRDLASSNGTFVNGCAIGEAELQHGDVVRAGQTRFEVSFDQVNPRMVESTLMPDRRWLDSSAPTPDVPRRPVAGRGGEDKPPPQRPALQQVAAKMPGARPPMAAPGKVEQLRLLIRTPQGNKTLWLRPGQSTTVGGTLAAQLTVRNDVSMSPVHFAVQCLSGEVRIRDLASKTGTLVNGQPIDSAGLRDGDVIQAGATEFEVAVDYALSAADEAATPGAKLNVQSHANGVTLLSSGAGAPTPLEVAKRLAEEKPLYLVVDFNRLDARAWSGATYLMNWLPRSLTANNSPVVVSRRELADFDALFAQAWGRDALVCVFSDWKAERLIEHLRIAARGQHRASAVANSRHMLGAMHPGRLKAVIPESAADYAEFLFSGVAALLFEGGAPDTWELLAPSTFAGVLSAVGIRASQASPEPQPNS